MYSTDNIQSKKVHDIVRVCVCGDMCVAAFSHSVWWSAKRVRSSQEAKKKVMAKEFNGTHKCTQAAVDFAYSVKWKTCPDSQRARKGMREAESISLFNKQQMNYWKINHYVYPVKCYIFVCLAILCITAPENSNQHEAFLILLLENKATSPPPPHQKKYRKSEMCCSDKLFASL